MFANLKKLCFALTFNLSLFLLLMVGLQNNSYKSKVNLIISKTIDLPIGFVIGISFISGSLAGSILNGKFNDKK
tara:strand:+ start:457 stop:678 length:222 start_codon:yes stop_codon:yes gene_type:complete